MGGVLIVLYLLLITPLQGGVIVGWEDHYPRGAAGIAVWGIRFSTHFAGTRDADGKFSIQTSLPGKAGEKPLPPPSTRMMRYWQGLRASRGAWKILRKGVHIRRGEMYFRLGDENAALLSLLAGALQALFSVSRRFQLHIQPFFQGKSGIRFRCIVETRLGTLLAAGLLGALYALAAGKKEEKAWIIPSET